MEQLKPFSHIYEPEMDLEFEESVLRNNDRVADLLIKRGYKIKKSVWSGLIAS